KLPDTSVKPIITDLHNTLVGSHLKQPTNRLKSSFPNPKHLPITLTILSNNNKTPVSTFSTNLPLHYIFKPPKPIRKPFKMAIKKMKIQP
ncbi:HAD family hydrolase, partial [Staphylococcus epidermidis]